MRYDNYNDEQRQMHNIWHDVTVNFFYILYYIKNIQLSNVASTVIKLNHSGIIFRERDDPGIVFPGK